LVGIVTWVSATGGSVRVNERDEDEDVLVPVEEILAVHRPHWHEGGEVTRRARKPRVTDQIPGQLPLIEAPSGRTVKGTRALMRAAGVLMAPDVIGVLAAVDAAGKRPEVRDVAEVVGRSERWTSARLRLLEQEAYVRRVRRHARRDIWMVM
jgi:hypothetical protein